MQNEISTNSILSEIINFNRKRWSNVEIPKYLPNLQL